MERSRRSGTKVKPHEKFEELRKLRESGKTRLSTYQVEEEQDLYEEVDEEEYKKVFRSRLDEDDFVVDDGGEGYVDNGMDDWGDEGRVYHSDEVEDEVDGQKLSKKELKRKREEEQERKIKQEGDLHRYFSKTGTASTKPKAVKTTAHDEEFLNDLLDEFDTTTAIGRARTPKKVKAEPARKTRRLSPPRKVVKKPDFGKSEAPMPSSPPAVGDESDYGEDISFIPPGDDDDIPMSDAPVPPSSPTKGVERNLPTPEDDDEEEEFAVAEIKANKNIKAVRVNITSSRPAKPAPLPIPGDSSPARAPAIDPSTWTKMSGGLNAVANSAIPSEVRLGKLSEQDTLEEDGSVHMFWLDYSEANGSLLLFGKVKDRSSGKYVSAFLKVDGIMRNLYFLPREYRRRFGKDTDEEVQMEEVYQEVGDIMARGGVDGFKAKPTSRKYAFELPGIPREGDYLKVLYPYTSRLYLS